MALSGQVSGVVREPDFFERSSATMRWSSRAVGAVLVLFCVVAMALHAPLLDAVASAASGVAVILLAVLRRSGEALHLLASRAPALAIGLGVVALAIPLAMLAGLLRWALGAPDQRKDQSPAAIARSALDAKLDDTTGFARPRRAWVEGKIAGVPFRRDLKPGLTRIGRESDNEIALLASRDIERYHAAIEHTIEYDIYVSDLTRGAKGQVRVNRRRCNRCRLRDGDRITCPGVALTFHTAST